jgi:hypothetical protein
MRPEEICHIILFYFESLIYDHENNKLLKSGSLWSIANAMMYILAMNQL